MTIQCSPVYSIKLVAVVVAVTLAVSVLSVGSNQVAQDGDDSDASKFNWRNHQEDHSVYAERSLMSSDNVVARRNSGAGNESEPIDLNENDDVDDETKAMDKVDFAEKEWNLMFRALDLRSEGVATSVLREIGTHTNIFSDIIGQLPAQCARDIIHIRESAQRHKLWALKMLDSIGKIPSGVTYGRLSSQGDYEECIGVHVDETVLVKRPPLVAGKKSSVMPSEESKSRLPLRESHHKFDGKYCLFDFRLPLPERPKDKILSIHDPVLDLSKTELGRRYPELANYSGYASVFYEIGYMHAFCLPSTCQVEDITRAAGNTLEGVHIIVNSTIDCQVAERSPIRTSQYISIALLSLVFLNAAFASIYSQKRLASGSGGGSKSDGANNNRQNIEKLDPDKQMHRAGKREGFVDNLRRLLTSDFYLDCFSVQSNFQRLSKPDPRGLTFVHYTRIVAMALTVVTHTAAMGTLQAITKPADASNSEHMFRDFLPQMLANAFTSIQIFFFMAGFMLVISTYPSLKRERGHLSFLEYAVKRAIRLLPGIVATLCINFLWPLFVNGPMVSYFDRMIVAPCETNWWRTMAFLSNFDHVEKMCLRHSYFSASDYQLHILAFPLLKLLYSNPVLALNIAGLLTVTGFVVQIIMILTKLVLPFMMVDYIDKAAFFNVVHYIHHPVWNHMSGFFYGFIIGYLVVKQIRVKLSAKTIKRVWIVVLPLGLASIFAPYYWNHYKRPIVRWQMILYLVIDRSILLSTCAWLSYATMVLGRPDQQVNKSNRTTEQQLEKPAKKSDVIAATAPVIVTGGFNLPSIVTLSPTESIKEPTDELVSSAKELAHTNRLDIATAAIPRQRSSPNLLAESRLPILRGAVSSQNVDACGLQATSQPGCEATGTSAQPMDKTSEFKLVGPQEEAKKRPQAVSNLNTLCLILSRLTFQLYLFNMVVLWIDVQESKYNWYFSYYFIITKATAIYIASSILATIFFVTLESPCLTLYIAWVKHRAALRASNQNASNNGGSMATVDVTNQGQPAMDNKNQQSGLHIKLGTPKVSERPAGSLISLNSSSPEAHEQSPRNQVTKI